jgi:hypothetical protein
LETEINKRAHQREHLGFHPFNSSGNQSPEAKALQWNHPYSFELLDVSRPHRNEAGTRQKTLFELELYFQEWVETCERLVIYRANPEFNKEVSFGTRMSVGTMCPQQWNHIKYRLSSSTPSDKESTRATTGIDNDGDKRGEYLESIEWFNGKIPNLRSPYWHMIKWWSEKNMCCQRALITSFGLQRHSWTGSVFVRFTYLTWSFNENSKSWTLI